MWYIARLDFVSGPGIYILVEYQDVHSGQISTVLDGAFHMKFSRCNIVSSGLSSLQIHGRWVVLLSALYCSRFYLRCLSPEFLLWSPSIVISGLRWLSPAKRYRGVCQCRWRTRARMQVSIKLIFNILSLTCSTVHYWSWQFTAFVHTIMEETFGSSRPAYSTIIDFDRKIRDFLIPVNLRVKCGALETRQDLYLQRLIVMCYKENSECRAPYPCIYLYCPSANAPPSCILRTSTARFPRWPHNA